MPKSNRTEAREWVEAAKPFHGIKVGDWLEEPAAISRRLEIVGLLTWYHEKQRENRWWKRATRWVLSKLTRGRWGVPVNRDPIHHLHLWINRKYVQAELEEDRHLEAV